MEEAEEEEEEEEGAWRTGAGEAGGAAAATGDDVERAGAELLSRRLSPEPAPPVRSMVCAGLSMPWRLQLPCIQRCQLRLRSGQRGVRPDLTCLAQRKCGR